MQSSIMQKNLRFSIRAILIVLIHVVFSQFAYSQTPTTGDCLGAFTVCDISYNQASFSGDGNITGEINSVCITSGETNSAWYIINVQTSGWLGFNIIPTSNNDYDWALYNLTNATCADIATNPALEVGCNFNGSTLPAAITGMNDGPNGQDEPRITVAAGDIYALLVNNFSPGGSGYQLNFIGDPNDPVYPLSEAGIIDITPPSLLAVTSIVSCGANAVSFNFNENVKCNTLDASMFQLIDPSGNNIPINDITSINCINGGMYDRDFTLLLDQNLTQGGSYEIKFSGQVEDNCGNINPVTPIQSLTFSFNSVEITAVNQLQDVDCRLNNGQAEVLIANGTGPISYNWSPSGQTNSIANNLPFGEQIITVTSGFCFDIDTIFMSDANNFNAIVKAIDDTCSSGTGTALIDNVSGGNPFTTTPNYIYLWSVSDQPTDNDTIFNLLTGTYNLTITDAFGCELSFDVEVPDYRFDMVPDFTFSPDTIPIPGLFPTVSFINGTNNATAFYWDFGTGDYSNLYEPNYVFPGSGSYDVKLIVSNPFGCIDSISKPVTIDFVLTFFAPTAFTPNDDLLNDSFNIVVSGIMDSTYLMVIYDKWGNEVFISNDLNKSWSGKSIDDNVMPSGDYTFRCSFIDQSGKKHVKRGRVVLFG